MKKTICAVVALILCLTAFCGCGNETENVVHVSPTEMADPAPLAEETQEEAPLTKEDYMKMVFTDPAEQTIEPCWDDFSPQEGSPIKPEPGDTKETWDLSIAALFPADEDCTDDEFFAKWMAVEGLTTADLDARGCTQLVISALRPSMTCSTYLTCYEKQADGSWKAAEGLNRVKGSCGKNGINHNRVQGDNTSPAGLYQLGTAFGNLPKPEGLKMPWRDVTEKSEWIGTNSSRYYNTWQELDDPAIQREGFDRDSGEHLIDYQEAYAYACVIRFNMPPYAVRNRGAAIFFHVSRGATAGCVGLPFEDFENCLLWLDPDQTPCILITGYDYQGV